MKPRLYSILILCVLASCSKHQTNPGDSNTALTISVIGSVGSLVSSSSDSIFIIQLIDPDMVKAVPVVLHCAAGARPSEGEPLNDSTWSDTVDISSNQGHSITVTSKSGKTEIYDVEYAYIINNYTFPAQQTVYAIAPHGDTVYVGDGNGLNISTDEGLSFKTIALPAPSAVLSIAVQQSTVYAGTNGQGLMISPDGGQTVQAYTFSGTDDIVTAVFALGDTVYAGSSGNGLYVSYDRGKSFSNVGTAGGLGNLSVTGVYAYGSIVYGSVVYVATAGGIFVSFDGGRSFAGSNYASALTTATGDPRCNGVSLYAGTLYAASDHGLWMSKDGVNFSPITPTGVSFQAVTVQGSLICAAGSNGLWVSMDGGASFATYSNSSGLTGNSVDAVAIQASTVYAGFQAPDGGLSVMYLR